MSFGGAPALHLRHRSLTTVKAASAGRLDSCSPPPRAQRPAHRPARPRQPYPCSPRRPSCLPRARHTYGYKLVHRRTGNPPLAASPVRVAWPSAPRLGHATHVPNTPQRPWPTNGLGCASGLCRSICSPKSPPSLSLRAPLRPALLPTSHS
ncbi:uncharacterized protein [Miscanthus floridulus]|uniref:uncharacterized protein n=1 Tax=Miscanthus floridulus TaxID=154761 RepID=UPI003459704F